MRESRRAEEDPFSSKLDKLGALAVGASAARGASVNSKSPPAWAAVQDSQKFG